MSAVDIAIVNRPCNAPTWVGCVGAPTTVAKIRMWLSGVFCRRAPSAGNCERQNMGRMIRATGWLRASGFGSSTAKFEIDLSTSPASGQVESELTMVVEAMAAGRATLVTESGRWVAIRPTGRTANGLSFTVLDDLATVARYFS
ncbi:hypothetical protein [Ancylobacter aquaticus]|nr:hypothetical protein [Ancylobacter aquaticus]